MRPQDKKTLKELRSRLDDLFDDVESLRDAFETLYCEHEEWMDERDYETDGRFSETPTGERAEQDHDNFEEWFDQLDSIRLDVENLCNDIDNNI